jgi:hypothetical protein
MGDDALLLLKILLLHFSRAGDNRIMQPARGYIYD